jgi:diacylglycerol kinase (ATP)
MEIQSVKKHRGWIRIFQDALSGIVYAFTSQRNFKIHFSISLLVIVLAFWLEVPFDNFLFLIFAIVFGLVVEVANTSFEKTVDLITEKYNERARVVKDLSAGMMLLTSIGMALIGFLILFPPLINKVLGL